MKKQYVGISRDHSGSMSGLRNAAMKDYNENIAAIKKASVDTNIDTIVSVVKCGVGTGQVEREVVNSGIQSLQPLTHYSAEGSTPLFDSVGELISIMLSAPDANEPHVTFLITAITDGEENSSRNWLPSLLSDRIKELQKTDRWTFVFRVPKGYKGHLAALGVPEGNIQEWEQTEEGLRESSHVIAMSTQSYYTGVSRGVTSSRSFFADAANINTQAAKANLVDISQEVRILPVKKGGQMIKPFIEKELGETFRLGTAFYQLTKPEKEVQDYKLIVIREKSTGRTYAGEAARDLLSLPKSGTIKLAPGDHGEWDIFIQSTSLNRILIANTNVLFWETAQLIKRQAAPASRRRGKVLTY